jgi:uncharacterized membrane protein YphA (DoxX/SURF4 family)
MLIAFWVLNGLLALVFFGSGLSKMIRPKEALISSGMAFAEDFTSTQVKLIGLAEVLGAIGLILPRLIDIAPVLTPIAAIGLAITMAGAVVVHVRRKESVVPATVLGLLSTASAVLGFLTL